MTTIAAEPLGGPPPSVEARPLMAPHSPWQLLSDAYHRSGSCLVISLILIGDALTRWGLLGRAADLILNK